MGSHVADELSNKGLEVTIYDMETSPWLRSDQQMIVGDLLDKDRVSAAVKHSDAICHFGGIADLDAASQSPLKTIEVNVMGTSNLLDAMVENDVDQFLFASSMYIFSENKTFYGASKAAVEVLLDAFCANSKITCTRMRFGSLFGPRSQPWNGLRGIIDKVINDKKLEINGQADDTREYIHVLDAARLCARLVCEGLKSESLTVTGMQKYTKGEIINIICELLDKHPEPHFSGGMHVSNHYRYTPYRYTPDIGKKIVLTEHIDFASGLLSMMDEMYEDRQ